MQLLSETRAAPFLPVGDLAQNALVRFVGRLDSWEDQRRVAENKLRDLVFNNTGTDPRGFVSNDPMNFKAYGLVFDTDPGPAFVRAPAHIAEKVEALGLRGDAYIPDVDHELGKQVHRLLGQVSSHYLDKPLFSGVPGVRIGAIEDRTVVLTSARRTPEGSITLFASRAAVSPEATMTVKKIAAAAIAHQPAPAEQQTSRMRMN